MRQNNPSQDMGFMQSEKKLQYVILLVSLILTGKFTGAFLTNSLALFSDSWHLATDLASLIISWWGLRIARRAANVQYTFGYYRCSILTALINNLSLIGISLYILSRAVIRYFHPVSVEPTGMIAFAILGLAINSIIVFILQGNSENMNVKSVFLHFVGDALADIGVLLGGTIIYFTGYFNIDTLLSAVLSCLILKSAVKMTIIGIKVILEAAPDGMSVHDLKQAVQSIHGVVTVKDLHVWSLSMEKLTMTAHVCIQESEFKDCEIILHNIQDLLLERFNIVHSVIQFEHSPCSSCYHSKPDHRTQCAMCIDEFSQSN
jgi:cobalt-zinc-cadmium efflux system protein